MQKLTKNNLELKVNYETIDLPIIGMDCPSCAVTIERSIKSLKGVRKVTVNSATEKANVQYDPASVNVRDLIDVIKKSGYRVGCSDIKIGIKGMYCASCVKKIEKTLLDTPGVLSASVNPGTEEAYVEYLPHLADITAIRNAVESTGYRAVAAPSEVPVDREKLEREKEYKRLFRKFLFAAIISVPVLIV
ncbi:MAG: copper ion binding protein, partial [Fidelibacterota bacterium]